MSTATVDRVAVERWAGEVRVNLVRLTALVAFYAYHLFDVYQNRDNPAYSPEYRASVAALAFAWAGVVVLAHAWLRRGQLPPPLPVSTTLADAALVTALVTVSGGPKTTPLVMLYLLVIAAAPLRLSFGLVYLATFAGGAGYLIALGHYVFVRIDGGLLCRLGCPHSKATGGDHHIGYPHGRAAGRAGGAAGDSTNRQFQSGGGPMTEPRCPNCSEPVRPGFRVCPYCAAQLGATPSDLPEVLPAEREGRKDLRGINAGLIALGALGGVGFLMVFRDGLANHWFALGVPFFLAFALTLLAQGGPCRAVLNGIWAVVAVFAIGLMIVGALFLYLLAMCSQGCR